MNVRRLFFCCIGLWLLTGLARAEFNFIQRGASPNLIIFIHGFMGSPNSFVGSSGRSWPELIASDNREMRKGPPLAHYSVAVVSYPASIFDRLRLEDIAERIRLEFVDAGAFEDYTNIHVISHSMGGLAVKRMLSKIFNRNQEDIEKIKSIFLISVPSQGAPAANFLGLLPKLGSTSLPRDLETIEKNTFLLALENTWQEILRQRTRGFPRVYCAYERKATIGIEVVPQVYTATMCDNTPRAENEDHISIVKPTSRKSSIYRWVRGRIAESNEYSGRSEGEKQNSSSDRKPSAQSSVAECAALAPMNIPDVQESFRGKIEGRLVGIIGKLAGGMTSIQGEYKKIAEDSLTKFPESHRLYVWQRLIYLACIRKGSSLDLNELAKAYLVGPTIFGSRTTIRESDLEIEVAGFDRSSSIETVGHYETPGGINLRLPDIVFQLNNLSREDIHVALDQCSFADFRYPEPIKMRTFGAGSSAKVISSVTGTALMFAVGPSVVRVPAGKKKFISFGVGQVEAPSFEARSRGTSECTFQVGDGNSLDPRAVEVASPGTYISNR